jgi:hypothetical protein
MEAFAPQNNLVSMGNAGKKLPLFAKPLDRTKVMLVQAHMSAKSVRKKIRRRLLAANGVECD